MSEPKVKGYLIRGAISDGLAYYWTDLKEINGTEASAMSEARQLKHDRVLDDKIAIWELVPIDENRRERKFLTWV